MKKLLLYADDSAILVSDKDVTNIALLLQKEFLPMEKPQKVFFVVFYIKTDFLRIIRQVEMRKGGKIRHRYNQTPHLTQDTNGKVTTSQLDITNESQEVSPFPAGDNKASINRRARKHNKTRQK